MAKKMANRIIPPEKIWLYWQQSPTSWRAVETTLGQNCCRIADASFIVDISRTGSRTMASILNSFELIPKEILGRIVSYLDSNASLLRLSSTCHYLRHTLAPRAFSKVKVQFSAAGLARLAQLSKLDIFRQNVEVLLYDVVEIIDPGLFATSQARDIAV